MLPPSSFSPSPQQYQHQQTINQSSSSRRQQRPSRQVHHPLLAQPSPHSSSSSHSSRTATSFAPPPPLPLPLLPNQDLLPPPSRTIRAAAIKEKHPLVRCDLTLLRLIQHHIGPSALEDHVAWSRVCRRMRRFYRGEEGGEEFWDVALLTRNGWGVSDLPLFGLASSRSSSSLPSSSARTEARNADSQPVHLQLPSSLPQRPKFPRQQSSTPSSSTFTTDEPALSKSFVLGSMDLRRRKRE